MKGESMDKTIACADFGMSCPFVAHGKTDEEVLKQIEQHGREVHGYKDEDFTPEMMEKMKSLIKVTA
jgi:predicted small metal-binding protein